MVISLKTFINPSPYIFDEVTDPCWTVQNNDLVHIVF
jgi:hypothetical protein